MTNILPITNYMDNEDYAGRKEVQAEVVPTLPLTDGTFKQIVRCEIARTIAPCMIELSNGYGQYDVNHVATAIVQQTDALLAELERTRK
jgi:hypothetical protein